ncbi:MAG: dihydroorotate dehydrogenase-like protein [Verrucomicrobia bacterium]|nr:dihydroorotate dehydrogenase-like protein [Verrucomicrobiota bacterium]
MKPQLETSWLGLHLAHPVVASAGPLTHELDNFRRLEDAGVAAIVMHSLFEEQITRESHWVHHYHQHGTGSPLEAFSYIPDLEDHGTGPDTYLSLISAAKDAVSIPVIASLNGTTAGGWRRFAREIQQAGADALELNLYHVPTSAEISGSELEGRYLSVVRDVSQGLRLPLAVKLSPFLTAPAHMAAELTQAGARGLVLFNRFYQPDINLDELTVVPRLVLSNHQELRLPLRWVAILYGQIAADLAITSGIHTGEDVIKGILAGAHVTMMTSEILQHGLGRISHILEALRGWMAERGYDSVCRMRGSLSQLHCGAPEAYERANYLATLQSWRPDASLGRLGE